MHALIADYCSSASGPVAYASMCSSDDTHNRPSIGYINVCHNVNLCTHNNCN